VCDGPIAHGVLRGGPKMSNANGGVSSVSSTNALVVIIIYYTNPCLLYFTLLFVLCDVIARVTGNKFILIILILLLMHFWLFEPL